jgi:hypothetical protein
MPRTTGAKDVSPRKKARILAKKNVQELTAVELAKEEGMCRNTVIAIKPHTVPPEVLEMSKRYACQFATFAEANALKAMQRTFDTIDELPADKASKVAETQFNLVRTIKGESTTNSQSLSDGQLARELLRRMVENYGWTEDKTIKMIAERFPDVDCKLLAESVY